MYDNGLVQTVLENLEWARLPGDDATIVKFGVMHGFWASSVKCCVHKAIPTYKVYRFYDDVCQ